MNEIYEGSAVEEGPGKLERTLFTLLYAFFLSICVQLILVLVALRLVLFLASWDSSNQLGSAFSWLTDFFKDCVGYLSFSTNEKPFPFNTAD